MVEIRKGELRVDEDVLLYITDEEMLLLDQICGDIAKRIRANEERCLRMAQAI